MKKIGNYINGSITIGNSNRELNVFNPATGENTSKVILSNENDFEKVINSSKNIFNEWSNTTPLKRSRILSNFKVLVEKNIDELASIISHEHGKTLEDAKGSITRGIEVVEFSCGIPHLLNGEFSQNVGNNIDTWSIRQPLGICAGITPFNFPAMVPMWMFPISIGCGNVFILKPSEKDPSCSLKLAELFSEAGLPDGVFNVINGDKEVVNMLLRSPEISSISFVGSTPIAKYIYEESAKYQKRVQALGGAKNHLVVMPDANLELAIDGIIGAAYGSAGERCMAVSVVVVVGNIADSLIDNLVKNIEKLKIGPFTDKESNMGPLISKEHLEKVNKYIQSGVEEGAKLIVDGRKLKLHGYENGYFLGPTLFDNVSKEMKIYKEEIFGPVLSLVRAKNYEEALTLVNKHPFGNGSSIYTSNGDIARNFTTNTKIGMVGVNIPIPVPVAFHSFGGWKNSLFGDSAMHGIEGIRFFTKLKTTTSRWPSSILKGPEFKIPTN
jgi:malonate-semialdehyde dehydrogenase (acetylating)/methylmalonate-semialdehyde dehydrogenase|tara:strand:- start:2694 stop:4184 length:1491 start_codon:yes stop_codon:yes gene_type:complete